MYLTLKGKNKNIINHFSAESLFQLNKDLNEINYFNNVVYATLHSFEEKLSCDELSQLKQSLSNFNIQLICIISTSRESIITAKSLKINGIYSNNNLEKSNPKNSTLDDNEDLTHIGIVRSGEQISSNGNLIIIGDVNPGAQISAKKHIYVWGKLSGVAFAGKNDSDKSTIAALFLNPLQLRINKTIAIGPKEKPKNNYPEIALIEKGKIIIKPLIIGT
mgnify:CR=1 FL=1